MSTYTLAADGTYTDSRTGGRFKYHAGAVLQMEDAVALGMPGATPDAPGNPFPTVEADWLDANVAGGGDGVSTLVALEDVAVASPADNEVLTYLEGDWTNSISLGTNVFPDGDFDDPDTADLYEGWFFSEVITVEGGSLKVVTAGDDPQTGVQNSNPRPPIQQNQPYRFSLTMRGAGTLHVILSTGDGADPTWNLTLTAEPQTVTTDVTFTINTAARIKIYTLTAQAITFYVDQISLRRIGAYSPDAHTHLMPDLTNFVITDPQDGDVLTYDLNSGSWVNQAPAP